jgi:prepilin-type N-terminal cleavage/methylation domain-containing protein
MGRSSRRGFTVLELLCVLGVLSVLLAIALPRASAVLPRLALDQAARQLAAELELARVKAINRNTRVRVVVDLAAASYRLEAEVEGRFEPEGAARRLPGGVEFDAAASTRIFGGSITITFLPRGHTADNATIALGGTGNVKRVIVSPSGRVRVE